jgi:uncharacterized iron-regulated membrane protein
MALKLSPHAFTRAWDVHAWAGVLGALVLYVMFLAGGLALFREELGVWEEPAAQAGPGPSTTLEASLARAIAGIGTVPKDMWLYPPRGDRGGMKLLYESGGTWRTVWLDQRGSPPIELREHLADFLYALHFLWHEKTGRAPYYTAGALAVLMLLAIATGVLLHLKDLVRQLQQFRPGAGRRVLFSDLHKVLGVMGLPFQILYAYTGALIVLTPLLLPAVSRAFGPETQRAGLAEWGELETPPPSPGPIARVLSLDVLAERARSRLRDPLDYLHLVHHGRDNGTLEAWARSTSDPSAERSVRLRELDGALDTQAPRALVDGTGSTKGWIFGLHFTRYSGPLVRVLGFVLALAAGATLLTGNFIWLARREARSVGAGNRLLSRLTAGVGGGMLVAVAALFLASRLLPLDAALRGPKEELIFLGVFMACVLWALASRRPGTLWWKQLAFAGCLLLPVPSLAARWSAAGLHGAGPALGTVAGIELGLYASAIVLLGSAWALSKDAR